MSLSLQDVLLLVVRLRQDGHLRLAETLERLWTMSFPRVPGNLASPLKKPPPHAPPPSPPPTPAPASPAPSSPIPMPSLLTAFSPIPAFSSASASSSLLASSPAAAAEIFFSWQTSARTQDQIADLFEWIYRRPPHDPLLFRILLSSLYLLLHLSAILEPDLRQKAPLLWDCYEVLQRETMDGRVCEEMRHTSRRLDRFYNEALVTSPSLSLPYAIRVFLEALLSGLKNATAGTVQALFAWIEIFLPPEALSSDPPDLPLSEASSEISVSGSPSEVGPLPWLEIREALISGVYQYLQASLWDN